MWVWCKRVLIVISLDFNLNLGVFFDLIVKCGKFYLYVFIIWWVFFSEIFVLGGLILLVFFELLFLLRCIGVK